MIVHPIEDMAAICGAGTPEELWRYLVTRPTLRAYPNDFDAVMAFKTLHGDGTPGAVRSAGLLCTDLRWRRCTTTLIRRVEDSGILTAAELDELAEAWLWEDHYYWPVPGRWLLPSRKLARHARHPGTRRVSIDRQIWPPLRKWSARRIATASPSRSPDVLERIRLLDSRAGGAAMSGLLDAAEGFTDEARDVLVSLGCQWPSESVRLRALRLLAVRDPERAAIMAANDVSDVICRRARQLRALAVKGSDDSRELMVLREIGGPPPSDQLALFS